MKNKLTLKIFTLLMLTDLLESFYEYLFKKGMLAIGEFNFQNLALAGKFILNAATNGWVICGLIILFAELFLWFFILSRIDLSVAIPIASTSYIYVLLISAVLLKETVTWNRWLGSLIIICGILLITKSAKTPERPVC